jgi:hypothetical protein
VNFSALMRDCCLIHRNCGLLHNTLLLQTDLLCFFFFPTKILYQYGMLWRRHKLHCDDSRLPFLVRLHLLFHKAKQVELLIEGLAQDLEV